MGIKGLARRALPTPVLEELRHRRAVATVRQHRRMSQPEVEAWLGERYHMTIGAELDLENPKRFTEKIQWCKLHAMDETKSMLSDKYAVREWVASRIGEDYLVPLLGVWTAAADIDFDSLPDAYVMKTNNASGTNIIVPDAGSLDRRKAIRRLGRWIDIDFGWKAFEPQYLSIRPRIVAEEFMRQEDGSEILDYKVLCFGGEPRFIWVDVDRHTRHSRVVFDTSWEVQPWNQYHYPPALSVPERPERLEELVDLARRLAEGFAQVRVDFYLLNGAPKFGEMTFTDGSGFEEIRPDEWDFRLGDMWDLSKEPSAEFPYGGD